MRHLQLIIGKLVLIQQNKLVARITQLNQLKTRAAVLVILDFSVSFLLDDAALCPSGVLAEGI